LDMKFVSPKLMQKRAESWWRVIYMMSAEWCNRLTYLGQSFHTAPICV
jgi:hypothetical protein